MPLQRNADSHYAFFNQLFFPLINIGVNTESKWKQDQTAITPFVQTSLCDVLLDNTSQKKIECSSNWALRGMADGDIFPVNARDEAQVIFPGNAMDEAQVEPLEE